VLQCSGEKIKKLNCFSIEIKVKYSVPAAALTSRAVMTDFIYLFMALEVDCNPKTK